MESFSLKFETILNSFFPNWRMKFTFTGSVVFTTRHCSVAIVLDCFLTDGCEEACDRASALQPWRAAVSTLCQSAHAGLRSMAERVRCPRKHYCFQARKRAEWTADESTSLWLNTKCVRCECHSHCPVLPQYSRISDPGLGIHECGGCPSVILGFLAARVVGAMGPALLTGSCVLLQTRTKAACFLRGGSLSVFQVFVLVLAFIKGRPASCT